jgi:hypothetical protein
MMHANPAASLAQQTLQMGQQTADKRFAMVFTGVSVALLALMVLREAKDLFKDSDNRGHFRQDHPPSMRR